MPSWDEIRGGIRSAYDRIESAYQEHVVSAVDKVKERPLLNSVVKMSLSAIPILGPNLRDLYDNIGGGKKSEEDKAKEILEFLDELEKQSKEQFDRITEDLKSNSQEIINAINQNKIEMAALITNSWKEIVDRLHGLQKTADVTLDKVEAIAGGVERIQQSILEHRPYPYSEYKRPPKPSTFRGESTKIFVGRKQDIDIIRSYFEESNLPVAITGEGGIGKSELAYKAMHKCEDLFDLIIPIYFGSRLTFESFLLEIAKSLNLPIQEFERKDIEEHREQVINTLGKQFKHPLIYADNYETISRYLKINNYPTPEEEKDNARKINAFLESIPPNTSILLTSRERYNLDGERPVRLDGLSETEGRDLFIELAKNHFPIEGPSEETKRSLEEVSRKTGGHPLSIEILARSYRGQGLSKIRKMLERMDAGVVNPKEETDRLKSLGSCFEYSFNMLPRTHRVLLSKLALFNSPFPPDAIEEIFGFEGSYDVLLDPYDHSLLRRTEFDKYEDDNGDSIDEIYHLYYFHPAIRNYLEHKIAKEANKQQDLEESYSEQFSLYYNKLVEQTYSAIGRKEQVLSLERFNVIISQGKDNDFDRAIEMTVDLNQKGNTLWRLGAIFRNLGIFEKALSYYKRALECSVKSNVSLDMLWDYTSVGAMLREMGKLEEALEYHKKALDIALELNEKERIGANYSNIGVVFEKMGKLEEALEYHKKALAIHEELDLKVWTAKDYGNIGYVLRNMGKTHDAQKSISKALQTLYEFEGQTGYHHPYIEQLEKTRSSL